MRVPIQARQYVPVRRSGLPGVALLAAVAVLPGVTACAGQTDNGTVHGTVFGGGGPEFLGRRGNHPLGNATVIVTGVQSSTKFETVTSHDGTFSRSVPPGTYVLEAGFAKGVCGEAWPRAVRVPPGGSVKRNIDCAFI